MRHLVALLVAGCSASAAHHITTETTDGGTLPTSDGQPTGGGGPIALVYRGPASCAGCAEAVAGVLQLAAFDVHFVGPNEQLKATAETLSVATLYAQPGSAMSVPDSFDAMAPDATAIDAFVHAGGRYLGFADGGWLAGHDPGFQLLPGDSISYIASQGASVRNADDTVIQVNWCGQSRYVYFQDGPEFVVDPGAQGVTVLATYDTGAIAALVAPFGAGKVGVVGPHPEADLSWYAQYKLVDPDGPDPDLALNLIDTLMQ